MKTKITIVALTAVALLLAMLLPTPTSPRAKVKRVVAPDGLRVATFTRYETKQLFRKTKVSFVCKLMGYPTPLVLSMTSIGELSYDTTPNVPEIVWAEDSSKVTFDFGDTQLIMNSFEGVAEQE